MRVSEIVTTLYNGAIVGVANIIPGVSGGTMALVLGIYERLINALHAISGRTVVTVLKVVTFKKEAWDDAIEELRRIDFWFLALLGFGAVMAVVALANLMTWLLEYHHDPTYGFFFGLVLLSVVAPLKMIKNRRALLIIPFIVAMFVVVSISEGVTSGDRLVEKARVSQQIDAASSTATTVSNKDNALHYIWFMILGAIAISAMILPGVSGSFLLLLLGGYFDILAAISGRDWPLLAVFAAGCGVGVLAFSRFLNWLMARWHDGTMAFLAGLVIGSLWMIWPFRHSVTVGTEVVYLGNRVPELNGAAAITFGTMLLGVAAVGLMLYVEGRRGEQ